MSASNIIPFGHKPLRDNLDKYAEELDKIAGFRAEIAVSRANLEPFVKEGNVYAEASMHDLNSLETFLIKAAEQIEEYLSKFNYQKKGPTDAIN